MGQTMSEPITTKNTASCSNARYIIGSSSMQGWRINMEDAHVHLLEVPNDPSAAYFAVFDGHGGARIAKHASQFLHKQICESGAYYDGKIPEALVEGFLALDEKMRENEELKEEMSGSTAIVVLIKNNCIYCANAGDSRAVVSITGRAVPLSTDHKPSNEEESRRIFTAGGWVEFNRVNGNLALSRALGDFAFKGNDNISAREQIVTACPEIETHAITAEHEFIILACDGIWDVMSNQEVVDFCREKLIAGMTPDMVCEELLNKCLAPDCELSGLGCDNMTAVLVCLLQDRTYDVFLKQLQKTAKNEAIDRPAQERSGEPIDQNSIQQVQATPMDDSEPNEEIFLTPSHSPPTNMHSTMSDSNEIYCEKISSETSDEDAPPNRFKVPSGSQSPMDESEKEEEIERR